MFVANIVCVIGAGFHGLIAARRFLELYPSTNLTIFEADNSLGGVWNRERVYDELLTESSIGMYEYSDEAIIGDHLSGKQISSYLETYAKKYNLYQRIRFNTRVKSFIKLKDENRWQVELENKNETIKCDKLIVATGLTSLPSIPIIPTASHFSIPQYHVRSLAKIRIVSHDQHVVVVGGAKSAYDAAYTMVKQGVKYVTLVIKETSPGPAWLLPEYLLPNLYADKFIGTRLVAACNPNIWSSNTTLHFLLHQTRIGQWIVKNIWHLAEQFLKWHIGYETNENLKQLLPEDGSLLWSGTNTCVLNHKDLIDMIKDRRIEVKRSRIIELKESNIVCFADGTELEADLLIWATGWKSNLVPLTSKSKKTILEQNAETYVLNQCPLLRERLTTSKISSPSFPLYRRIVPIDYINDHSIVYVGMLQSPGIGVIAEVQAIWSALYLMNQFEIIDDVEWEVAVTNVWLRRRYPLVERHSNYTHDFIQYADLLLKDLGLNTKRKSRYWWKEIFETYMASDYKGLALEWNQLHKETKTINQNQVNFNDITD